MSATAAADKMLQEAVYREAVALRLDTDVVASQVAALRTRLKELIAAGTIHLSVDFAEVRMVDSAGIGLIISTHNSLRKAGGKLELTGVAPELDSLFRSMRLHQHFRIVGVE